MAFTFGFYNSLNHDRVYNAEQVSSIFDGLITDGVFETIGEIFAVVPESGMQINVKTGKAWFNHTWNVNDSWMPLFIEPADVLMDRYDTVVIDVDARDEARTNSIKIVKGIASLNPEKPVLANMDKWHQHPLAHIRVKAGAEAITAENIEILVGTAACPFVTGPLETVPIDDLYNRWEAEFSTWFANLKAQLTDNVVTNLQNQIDQKLDIGDKAPANPPSTDNSHWVTPQVVSQMIDRDVYDIGDTVLSFANKGTNWHKCDGTVFSRTTHQPLFDRIKYTFGFPYETKSFITTVSNDTSNIQKAAFTVGNYGYFWNGTGAFIVDKNGNQKSFVSDTKYGQFSYVAPFNSTTSYGVSLSGYNYTVAKLVLGTNGAIAFTTIGTSTNSGMDNLRVAAFGRYGDRIMFVTIVQVQSSQHMSDEIHILTVTNDSVNTTTLRHSSKFFAAAAIYVDGFFYIVGSTGQESIRNVNLKIDVRTFGNYTLSNNTNQTVFNFFDNIVFNTLQSNGQNIYIGLSRRTVGVLYVLNTQNFNLKEIKVEINRNNRYLYNGNEYFYGQLTMLNSSAETSITFLTENVIAIFIHRLYVKTGTSSQQIPVSGIAHLESDILYVNQNFYSTSIPVLKNASFPIVSTGSSTDSAKTKLTNTYLIFNDQKFCIPDGKYIEEASYGYAQIKTG